MDGARNPLGTSNAYVYEMDDAKQLLASAFYIMHPVLYPVGQPRVVLVFSRNTSPAELATCPMVRQDVWTRRAPCSGEIGEVK
jgi:hypothetical protein